MKILLAWMLFLFEVNLNSGHYIWPAEEPAITDRSFTNSHGFQFSAADDFASLYESIEGFNDNHGLEHDDKYEENHGGYHDDRENEIDLGVNHEEEEKAPESFTEPKPLTDKDVKEAFKARSYLFDQMRQRYEPAIERTIPRGPRSKRQAEFPAIPEPPQLSGDSSKDAYIQPNTHGMNLNPEGGYVWNNLNNPGINYELGQSPNGDQIEGQNGSPQSEERPPPYEINNLPPPTVPSISENSDSGNSEDIYVNINRPSAEALANDGLSAEQNPVPVLNDNLALSQQPPQYPIEPVLNESPKTEDSKQEESNPVAPVSEISEEPVENVGSNEKPVLNENFKPDDTKEEEFNPVSGILVSENPVKPIENLSSNENPAPDNSDQESYEKPLEESGIDKPAEAEIIKKIPEAPVLPPLNYDNLPDYIRQAISSTEKAGTYGQTDNPYVNPQLDADDKKVMDEKMEEIFATVQPVEDIPKTYGMNLSSDGGHVWNDLVNPPVSYDIGPPNSTQEEVSKESTTNSPATSEQPEIQPGSESNKTPIPVEPIQPPEPIAPFEPTLPVGSDGSIEPPAPIEPTNPVAPLEPKPNEPILPLEPVAPFEPTQPVATDKPLDPTALTEPVEPAAPLEPKPDEPILPLEPAAPFESIPPIGSEGSFEPATPNEPVKPAAPLEPNPDESIIPQSVQPTYGMNLSSDGGHVWNDLVNPPVSYDIGSPNSTQKEVSKESATNTPATSEQPEIQPGSESNKPKPDEPVPSLESLVPFEPTLPVQPERPLEPAAPIEPLEPSIPREPKPDEPIQPLEPLAPIGLTPTVNPEGPVIPIEPLLPIEPKPEESVQPIEPKNPTPSEPELPVGLAPVKPVKPDEEEKHPEVNVPAGSEEGETPKPDSEPTGGTEDQLEDELNHPEQKPEDDTKKPDIMNELLKSEQFWKWLGEWTASYMELLEKRIRKIAIEEICNHEKTGSDMCLLGSPEAGPVIKDGKLTIDGKELDITHTDNLHLQRKRGASAGSKVDATTIYGNSVGNEKVTNVFIFNPDKTKEILEEMKPGNGPVNFIIDERIKEEIKKPSAEIENKVTNEPKTNETEENGVMNENAKEFDEIKEIADVKEKGDADKPVSSELHKTDEDLV